MNYPKQTLLAWACTLFLLTAAFCAASAQSPATAPASAAADDFTLVVLPDTQIYAMKYPATFHAQTKWIADNAAKLNIKYVLHLGDITNNNIPAQWLVARQAMARLDGKVPCALTLGNHDIGPGGNSADRGTLLGKYFPMAYWKALPTFGGVYDKEPESLANTFHVFDAGGRKWLVLALEFAPRDDVLRWAGQVAAAHKDRRAIVITHGYMYPDGLRYDRGLQQPYNPARYRAGRDGNDGQQIWTKLVSPNENIRLVICGHVWTTGRRSDANAAGKTVHQMVVDYQRAANGGDGYLRVMKFSHGGEQAEVYDYSPVLDKINPDPGASFHLDFSAAPQSKPQAASQPATGKTTSTDVTNDPNKIKKKKQ
ncbi:MAG: metallophosphoesterase [Planctomycetaceae bacterium]|nr:metallophosphoesterase [Planctomycetaceae bacterium]